MAKVDAQTIRRELEILRETVSRLEQTLPSVPPAEREQLITTLVAYDERVDALERAFGSAHAH